MNQKLGSTAKEEIRKSMTGLVGAAAKAEATRLADLHSCSVAHIYEMTADLRPQRKKRSDAGKRQFDIVEGTDTFEVAQLVVGAKLDPDQALLTAKANGHEDLPSLATMQRLLREKIATRKRRESGKRSHRRFEAAAPLDMIQIDCTALKVRWLDLKTRRIQRIEGIDKNHPQLNEHMVRVWQILAVDDHTRRKFLKYVVTGHITSKDMVSFFCDLACEWGLPVRVYTDNGPEFKGFFAKAATIIASIPAIKGSGGFEHMKHAPNNAQASGKVENGHKWAEKMDRYVGLAIAKGVEVTAEKLQGFAENICRDYNESHVNRTTGETPLARWFGQRVQLRMLPQETIKSALLFDEATRKLTDTWTVRVGKVDYRIPAKDPKTGHASPFKVGMTLSVVAPHELDRIFVTLPNGEEYDVDKIIANADIALDWKSPEATESERLTKQLKEAYAESNRVAKQQRQLTGETFQVPHFNHEIAAQTTGVLHFPHPQLAVTAEQVAEVSPVPTGTQAPSPATDATRRENVAYTGRPVDFWQSLSDYKDRFPSITACKDFLMTELFPNMAGTVPITQVEAAIDRYLNPQKEAAQLRIAS